MTIDELFVSFERDEKTRLAPSTLYTYKWYFERYMRELRVLELTQVSPALLQRLFDSLDPKLSHQTYARLKSLLSALYSYAIRKDFYSSLSPVREIKLPRGRAGRETYAYTREEFERTLDALGGAARLAVALAGYAALRAGEIRGLSWRDVKLEEKLIYVERSVWRGVTGATKTKASARPVPIAEPLEKILREAEKRGERVIPISLTNLTERVIRPALATRSLRWLGWNGLRRTTATLLYQAGASDMTVARVLRHTRQNVTREFYIKTPDETLRNALTSAFSESKKERE